MLSEFIVGPTGALYELIWDCTIVTMGDNDVKNTARSVAILAPGGQETIECTDTGGGSSQGPLEPGSYFNTLFKWLCGWK